MFFTHCSLVINYTAIQSLKWGIKIIKESVYKFWFFELNSRALL